MKFMEKMAAKAKENPKSIAFPEATELKILQAARHLKDEGIAHPVLVGDIQAITDAAKIADIIIEDMKLIDINDEEFKEKCIQDFLLVNQLFSEKALNRKFKKHLDYAAALVRLGYADALAAGLIHTTGEVILTAGSFIGMTEGLQTVSSIGIVEFPYYSGCEENFLIFGDCAVNPEPNSEQLADIAIASADTAAAVLGWEPRVAMMSFSTKGSSEHANVSKVTEAVRIAKEKRSTLKIDGEFQLDAAILPAVAAKKVKGESDVAGKANICIFPDLGSGNIGVKIAQIFGHAIAHGPLLQGFAKPVTDFSRSAPLEEMIGNLTLLVNSANKEGI